MSNNNQNSNNQNKSDNFNEIEKDISNATVNENNLIDNNIVIKMNSNNNVKNKKSKNYRKRLFEIIQVAKKGDYVSVLYDIIMIISIIISLLPLAFKETHKFFAITDLITTSIFILDYILRYITADYKLNKGPVTSFIIYPFTLWALIDLFSILPSITLLFTELKMLRILVMIKTLKTFRTLKIIRVFKAFRYSKSIDIISDVIKNSKHPLMAVGTLALGYILTSALIIFNVESDSFKTFFDAVYWATVSLTTVGYGDIYPVTTSGRVIAMFSSLFGIALVALPAGIITAGYMDSLNEIDKRRKNSNPNSNTNSSASVSSETITIGNRDI